MTDDNYRHIRAGFLCALAIELQAVLTLFDQRYRTIQIPNGDSFDNYYTGIIGNHDVVAACLPYKRPGVASASEVATRMMSNFPELKYRFMVGIAGGIPDDQYDIRLGDVVIGEKIINYEEGKIVPSDYGFQFRRHPHDAPKILNIILSRFEVEAPNLELRLESMRTKAYSYLPELPNPWDRPLHDWLFQNNCHHINGNQTCDACDMSQQVDREERGNIKPKVFIGCIASGDKVIKDSIYRENLKRQVQERYEETILAIEMEAAGLDHNEFIVIRGISDYADSHKKKEWQSYAAATAAACAGELLQLIPSYVDGRSYSPNVSINSLNTSERAEVPGNTEDLIRIGQRFDSFGGRRLGRAVSNPSASKPRAEAPGNTRDVGDKMLNSFRGLRLGGTGSNPSASQPNLSQATTSSSTTTRPLPDNLSLPVPFWGRPSSYKFDVKSIPWIYNGGVARILDGSNINVKERLDPASSDIFRTFIVRDLQSSKEKLSLWLPSSISACKYEDTNASLRFSPSRREKMTHLMFDKSQVNYTVEYREPGSFDISFNFRDSFITKKFIDLVRNRSKASARNSEEWPMPRADLRVFDCSIIYGEYGSNVDIWALVVGRDPWLWKGFYIGS